MGLIIKNNITITGTTIDIPEVYGRIEFAGRADGKTLEIALSTYASKNAFKTGASVISTSVPMSNTTVQLQEEEVQSVETAHLYSKTTLEQQGFEVIIDL
jgi:hypothetical protein